MLANLSTSLFGLNVLMLAFPGPKERKTKDSRDSRNGRRRTKNLRPGVERFEERQLLSSVSTAPMGVTGAESPAAYASSQGGTIGLPPSSAPIANQIGDGGIELDVTSEADDGPGSLREATNAASLERAPVTIEVKVPVIVLDTTLVIAPAFDPIFIVSNQDTRIVAPGNGAAVELEGPAPSSSYAPQPVTFQSLEFVVLPVGAKPAPGAATIQVDVGAKTIFADDQFDGPENGVSDVSNDTALAAQEGSQVTFSTNVSITDYCVGVYINQASFIVEGIGNQISHNSVSGIINQSGEVTIIQAELDYNGGAVGLQSGGSAIENFLGVVNVSGGTFYGNDAPWTSGSDIETVGGIVHVGSGTTMLEGQNAPAINAVGSNVTITGANISDHNNGAFSGSKSTLWVTASELNGNSAAGNPVVSLLNEQAHISSTEFMGNSAIPIQEEGTTTLTGSGNVISNLANFPTLVLPPGFLASSTTSSTASGGTTSGSSTGSTSENSGVPPEIIQLRGRLFVQVKAHEQPDSYRWLRIFEERENAPHDKSLVRVRFTPTRYLSLTVYKNGHPTPYLFSPGFEIDFYVQKRFAAEFIRALNEL